MADYQWKPLTDEKKFEDLVNDLCSEKYGLEFQIYGRKGQKQHGIDGSALTSDKKHILHQCKNKMISRTDSAIQSELLKDLDTETEAMLKEFVVNKKYRVDKFIFANSFKRDTKIQNRATELSSTHSIMVIVWSWDEISDMLEEYDSVAKKYYAKYNGQKIETNTYVERIDNHGGIINIYNTDKQVTLELSDQDIKNSTETLALKALLKDMPIENLKIKAYKYLPISYFASLPNSVEGLIDRLLELSVVKEGCIPIIALFENHPDKIVIDFIEYLKKVKFSHIENFVCHANSAVQALSLLINISQQDGNDKFKVETWRYANSETHRIFDEILEIDLDDKEELTNFLDKVYIYLEEARAIYKSTLSIELILPSERFYQNFKSWGNSKGISMIRKYQYLHRLQSRFLQPDDNWKNKWEELEDSKVNIVKCTKFIEGFSYKSELSNANYKVVLKEKIENENILFSDIEEFGIPILLSSLSTECNVKEIKDFKFKGCEEEICTHIMNNHDNVKSDLFFMVDNPNKIPNEFKNPEQNLYDW